MSIFSDIEPICRTQAVRAYVDGIDTLARACFDAASGRQELRESLIAHAAGK